MWNWGSLQTVAFVNLKTALGKNPVLKTYDANAPIELHVDASSKGVAGIYCKNSKIVCIQSHITVNNVLMNKASTIHSLLKPWSFSLRQFWVYLLCKSFTIYTDCAAVRSTFEKKDSTHSSLVD